MTGALIGVALLVGGFAAIQFFRDSRTVVLSDGTLVYGEVERVDGGVRVGGTLYQGATLDGRVLTPGTSPMVALPNISREKIQRIAREGAHFIQDWHGVRHRKLDAEATGLAMTGLYRYWDGHDPGRDDFSRETARIIARVWGENL